jgi:signal transduction histidine kinase
MKGPLRVLVVEDRDDDFDLLLRELRRGGYEISAERVETAAAMTEALSRGDWDLVFSDWFMPAFSAPQALEILKESGRDIPFVIVSGAIGEETAVDAMRNGAHDFMLKDRLGRLLPAVERELREARLRRERARMQEQLLIADRMASIGTLAAGVAHEINNPLGAVMLNLDVAAEAVAQLRRQYGASEPLDFLREGLRDCSASAERIRDIVADLKMFSRAQDAKRDAVSVRTVLESSIRLAWNEIRHRAQLVKDYRDAPPVLANEARLGQVFVNLLVNAAQAIPDGRAEHNEIRVCTGTAADGRALVEISDSGAGMTPEVLRKLFTPFFTTKPIGVGTGLGLSICHRIVSEMGGEIAVDSRPGGGSRFRVLLPAALDLPAPGRLADATAVPAPPSRRPRRVLVVDDEAEIGAAVERALGAEHEVKVLLRGDEALALLRSRASNDPAWDLILCDLMMPEMSGMELHEAVLREAPLQAARMVFMSGGAFTGRARSFLDEPGRAWIEKPFSAADLRRMLAERSGG